MQKFLVVRNTSRFKTEELLNKYGAHFVFIFSSDQGPQIYAGSIKKQK